MTDPDTRLQELLLQWRERHEAGAPVTPDELCATCPELLGEFKARLAALNSMESFLDPSATTVEAPILTGKSVGGRPIPAGRYLPTQFHAKGGLGEVYRAEDTELHRQVALKRIQAPHAGDAVSRRRFLVEAEVTARLEHPGIVPVYGLVEDASGQPCYAMRFIEGESLAEAMLHFHASQDKLPSGKRLFEHSLEFRQLLQRFVTVCNTLAYAHSRGVIHRDVKPANVMLGKYGETLVVDWGLAKSVGRDEEQRQESAEVTLRPRTPTDEQTAMGSAIGTPAYMSPEQAAGRWNAVGAASDIYSLGATLYQLLTGRPPFEGKDLYEMIQRVQRGEFPRPREILPEVPRGLEAICLKATAFKQAERYATATDMAADVERWLADEPVSVYRGSFSVRARRWMRRRRTMVTSAGAALLVLSLTSAVAAGLLAEKNTTLDSKNQQLDQVNGELDRKNKDLAQAINDESKARKRAEDVLAYFVSVFRRPDPSEDGEKVTIVSVLRKSAKELPAMVTLEGPTRVTLLNSIGHTYAGLGLYDDAITVFEAMRSLALEVLGPDHRDTLASMNNLATAYDLAGREVEGLALCEEMLKRITAKLGPDHAETLAAMNTLANAYHSAGRLSEALSLYEKTHTLSKERLGPTDAQTLLALSNLAHAYESVGRLADALPLQEEVFKLQRAKFGAGHPATLLSMNNLAHAYQSAGRLTEALPLHEETLKQRRARLGPDHPDTALSANNLAHAYQSAGRLTEALPLYEEALKVRRAKLGTEHPSTLNSMNNLASGYVLAGRQTEAIPLFEETLALRKGRLGPEHTDTLSTMDNLALAYRSAGRLAEALPLLQQTYTVRKAKLGPDHFDTLGPLYTMGRIRLDLREYPAAEALLLECHAGAMNNPSAPGALRRGVVEQLLRLYDFWGKPAQANEWLKLLPPGEQVRHGLQRHTAWPLLWGWPRFPGLTTSSLPATYP